MLNKRKSIILTAIECVGIIATGISAGFDTIKAKKKIDEVKALSDHELSKQDIIVTAAPCYIPTASIAAGTIACCIGRYKINAKDQATLIAGGNLLSAMIRHKDDLITGALGENGEQQLIEMNADNTIEEVKKCGVPSEDQQYIYEPILQKWLIGSEDEVYAAAYKTQEIIENEGEATLGEFWINLGIDLSELTDQQLDYADSFIWNETVFMYNNYSGWSTDEHIRIHLLDHITKEGVKCKIIDYATEAAPRIEVDEAFKELYGCQP